MELIDTKKMSHSEWLRKRREGVGGSEISVIMGLSKYKSPYELWLEKTNKVEIEETSNEVAYFGTVLEDVVRKEYAKREGVKVERCHFMFKDGPRIANIDGAVPFEGKRSFVKGKFVGRKLFEAKTSSAYLSADWGLAGSDAVPDGYILQVHQYMSMLGADVCDISCLHGGNQFKTYTINFDKDLDSVIQEAIDAFWNQHVKKDIPPDPRSLLEVQQMYPISKASNIIASEEIEYAWRELKDVREEIKELKLTEGCLKDEISIYLGKNDELRLPNGDRAVTWKTSKGTRRVNWEGIATDLGAAPELINKYTVEAPGIRKFLIK